ncbi:MAG: hypothetical protein IBJ11_05490 [Phycisphaerales bacterium]|nr:hypothetical protein [Phycisphaerales bacterium]
MAERPEDILRDRRDGGENAAGGGPVPGDLDIGGLLRGAAGAPREPAFRDRALEALRKPVHAPDLSRQILDRVGVRRRWLTRRAIRQLTWKRGILGAALVLALGGAFLAQRVAPEHTVLAGRQRPLAALADAASNESVHAMERVFREMRSVQARVVEDPVMAALAARRGVEDPTDAPVVLGAGGGMPASAAGAETFAAGVAVRKPGVLPWAVAFSGSAPEGARPSGLTLTRMPTGSSHEGVAPLWFAYEALNGGEPEPGVTLILDR